MSNVLFNHTLCRAYPKTLLWETSKLCFSVLSVENDGNLFIDHGKWNESGFRPPLCKYRLSWARRTSWGWWDEWDDTVLQTQDSKFEPWRSEAEHATSRSRRITTILSFTRAWERNIFVSFKPLRPGTEPPNSGVKGSGANHYPRAPAHMDHGLKVEKLPSPLGYFCRPYFF